MDPAADADKQKLGRKGEQLAVAHLKKHGYRILHRNWECPLGEIDVIARDAGTTCFIEVKTRVGDSFGQAIEAVSTTKQAQIVRAALGFLMQHKLPLQDCRFDVVAVQFDPQGKKPVCELIQDAFPATSFYKY